MTPAAPRAKGTASRHARFEADVKTLTTAVPAPSAGGPSAGLPGPMLAPRRGEARDSAPHPRDTPERVAEHIRRVAFVTTAHNGGVCGRYADFLTEQELADAFSIAMAADDERLLPPSYNVAPMQTVRVIRAREGAPSLDLARWGLVPTWAKDPSIGSRMINARVETIAEKPSFRSAFAKRRCIVPANGYFEWQKHADGKTPFYIHPADDAPLAFGGLLEAWRPSPADEWLITCCIVTTAARGAMADIHDRQPVMFTEDNWRAWLDPHSGKDDLFAAVAADAPDLLWHEVGKAVGNVRNNEPELVAPVA